MENDLKPMLPIKEGEPNVQNRLWSDLLLTIQSFRLLEDLPESTHNALIDEFKKWWHITEKKH